MKKQIVVLTTDTTRKDMVGCYGNEKMKTPNLDRLAHEGIRYENAYTCQPVCGPARGAIFTGAFPQTNFALEIHRHHTQRAFQKNLHMRIVAPTGLLHT